ncbi:hypothetical protein M3J09_011837 [Ascochyta lentis]
MPAQPIESFCSCMNAASGLENPMYVPIEIVVDASLDSTITRRNDFIQLVHTQAARLRFDL